MKKIIGSIFYTVGVLAAILLHCYTVYWIYEMHGIFWAFVSFCAPPFSELLMVGASIGIYGWFNSYLIYWGATLICFGIGQAILEHESEKLKVYN